MTTRKVRIKVLIDDAGHYCGYGWDGAGDKDPDETLYSVIEGMNTQAYWITVDLPIPSIQTLEATAEIEQPK